MRILFSFISFSSRSGGELFVRDVALGLSRLGHTVLIYAPLLGKLAEEVEAQGVSCTTMLHNLPEQPDVIIGNSHVETVFCLATFPKTPVVSICHDAVASHGIPPLFSRICRYVAVDALCLERLQLEYAIPPEKTTVIHNRVDLSRFQPRPALPTRPRTAAIFSNYATKSEETEVVKKVCAEFGIRLDVIGKKSGNLSESPENILQDYDLVFAKARCAMEAMVVGCAVILLNEGFGMAGLVTSSNVAEWQRWNFGRKLLSQNRIEPSLLRQEIAKYSADDGDQVSSYMRQHCALEETVREFDGLLSDIVRNNHNYLSVPAAIEQQELRQFATTHLAQPAPRAQSLEMLQVQVGILQQQLANPTLNGNRQRQKLQALYGSLSWKVTKPLRTLTRKLRNSGLLT